MTMTIERTKKVGVERVIRVLHVSDVHCATGNLVRVLESEDYDLVLATGDFECVDSAEALTRAKADVYAITGNMDNAGVYRKLKSLGILLDGRITFFEDITIGGLGGLDFKGSMEKFKKELSDFETLNVLMTHHPPAGILDEPRPGLHIGLPEVKDIVERLKPRLHIFGHVHEMPGHVVKGSTVHVNAGPLEKGYYAIISYSGDITVYKRRLSPPH